MVGGGGFMRRIEELSEDELENYFNLSTVFFIPIPNSSSRLSVQHLSSFNLYENNLSLLYLFSWFLSIVIAMSAHVSVMYAIWD